MLLMKGVDSFDLVRQIASCPEILFQHSNFLRLGVKPKSAVDVTTKKSFNTQPEQTAKRPLDSPLPYNVASNN